MDRYDIFDYCFVGSRIHSLNFLYKVISIILVLFCIVISNSVIDIFIVNMFLFILMLWSNIRIRYYFYNVINTKIILFLVLFMVSFISLNIVLGIMWCVKVIDFILYLSIIVMTTSINDVVYGIDRLFYPFRKYIDVSDMSINLGIYVRFFTILYSESNRIKNSKMLRGVKLIDIGFIDKLDYIVNSVVPVYRSTIDRMSKLREIMLVRNFSNSFNRCNYRLNKWGKTDTILLVINVLVIVIIFIY